MEALASSCRLDEFAREASSSGVDLPVCPVSSAPPDTRVGMRRGGEGTGTGIEYHPFPFPTLTATFERVIRSIPTCHAKDTKLPEVTYTRHELLRSLAISGYSTSWLIAICGEYFWGLNSVCLWKADSVVISRSDARGSSRWKYSKGAGVFDLTTGVGCLKD
ncbi:hypothetical protein HZH66_014376 [Vespula vulgaris]|uniref:Uncharacterized protein n=1 Tax=Vespula vulgaris TaxID=7454 RepID=A0A834J2M7_VESVU|nr:hypothetical protein HZH66_014376 [Vespula vulgaris]